MMKLLSPAKINLFLRVVGKRSDGYHNLASLFQAIDLCDTLTVEQSDIDVLTCSDPAVPVDHTNLINRALDLFRKRTGSTKRYAIRLEKHIPMQGGLGGGSSNAATALSAFNAISGAGIGDDLLASWGAEIGSDVPFFFSTGTAYCTGRGEIVKNLKPCFSCPVHLVKPPKGVCTSETFRFLDISKLPERNPEVALEKFIRGETEFFNDLELSVFQRNPFLLQLKERLLSLGYSDVLMSGSGSSFFCLGDGEAGELAEHFHRVCLPMQRVPGSWYQN